MDFMQFAVSVDEAVRKRGHAELQADKIDGAIRWQRGVYAAQLSECFGLAVLTLMLDGRHPQTIDARIEQAEVDVVAAAVDAFLAGPG